MTVGPIGNLMAKKTKKDWFEVAYKALTKSGVDAISAEKLAQQLGVSRGSFYHHFGSKEGFHRDLLEDWLQRNTYQIKTINEGKSDEERLKRLTEFAWALPHEIEVAIRAWALYDELAKEYQIKNDRLRLKYTCQLFEAVVGKDKAYELAQVLYYSFIGLQNRQPAATIKEIDTFKKSLNSVLESYLT